MKATLFFGEFLLLFSKDIVGGDNIYKFYTCRYDRAFKEVFMNEANKDLLIYLLEGVLKLKIKKVEYLNLEQNSDNIYVKRKHFDLFLKTDIGNIQVEVNASNLNYVKPRNMSYLCAIYSHHVLKGQNYTQETKIIQINFSYGLQDTEDMRVYYVQDKSQKHYVENFTIYEINMEKYINYWYTKDKEKIEANKEIIMLDLGLEELKLLSLKDGMVKKYMEEIKRVNEDPDFFEYMSAEEDNRKIENSIRQEMTERGLKEGLEKGMKKGIQQGMKQGIQQGLKQGIEQGRKELVREKRKIVMSMFNQGLDLDTIERYTQLDRDFILSCQK